MEDSAEIMERGGLLPDGPNEEMELRDTVPGWDLSKA